MPSDGSVQMAGPYLLQSHGHLTIPMTCFPESVYGAGVSQLIFCHQLAGVRYFLTLFSSKFSAEEVICTSRTCCIDPFTPPNGVKHLGDNLIHTSPSNCIPLFNSSISVKHLFLQFLIQSVLDVTFLDT